MGKWVIFDVAGSSQVDKHVQGKSLEDFNKKALKKALKAEEKRQVPTGPFFDKLPAFPKLTNTGPFAAWFVVTGDVTPDGVRVERSVLAATSSPPIVVFRG